MSSFNSGKSASLSSQGSFVSDISSLASPKAHDGAEKSQISRARNSTVAKNDPMPSANANHCLRANLRKPCRVPNTYEPQRDVSDDEAPSVRPEGYKSPHSIVEEEDRIEVWWEGDDKYYRGTVRSIREDGKRRVDYDDGQVMYHFLNREVFILTDGSLERFLATCFPGHAQRYANSNEPVHYPGLAGFLEVGHRVRIYWHEMNRWYRGVVKGKGTYGRYRITYDDEDKALLRMEDETFRFIEEAAAIVHTHLLEKCFGI